MSDEFSDFRSLGSRGEACDKVCGFQRQRKQTTRGQVILRILRILRETKNDNENEPTQEARAETKFTLIMPSNKEEKTTKWD
jgi:hypothetical protein